MAAFIQEWSVQIKSYNKNIKLAFLATLFIQIGLGIFSVIYNFYIRELGYSEEVNGQVISMTSLATALILIPAGMISDKFGRKKVMLFGTTFTGIVLLFRGIFELQSALLALAFIGGLTSAFIFVTAIPLLSENSSPSQRVHLFSMYSALMTVANVIGNMLGGFLTDLFSLFIQELWGIRITLIIGAVIFAIALIPISRFSDVSFRENENDDKIPLLQNIKQQKEGVNIILLFAIAQLLIGFGSGLVIPYLNLYFADRFSASNSIIGIIISLGQAATAVAMIIGPYVVRKIGEVKAVAFLQLASLPFLLLTAYTQNLFLAATGFIFRQALMNAGNPIQSSLMMSKVNHSIRGLANSVNQMVFNLGWALMGPVSTGIVHRYGAYWGYVTVFTITAILYLIGSVYFLIVFSKLNISSNEKVKQ